MGIGEEHGEWDGTRVEGVREKRTHRRGCKMRMHGREHVWRQQCGRGRMQA